MNYIQDSPYKQCGLINSNINYWKAEEGLSWKILNDSMFVFVYPLGDSIKKYEVDDFIIDYFLYRNDRDTLKLFVGNKLYYKYLILSCDDLNLTISQFELGKSIEPIKLRKTNI
jgi:hypothetical protein